MLATPIPAPNSGSTLIFSMAVDVADHILYYASSNDFYEVKYGTSFSNAPQTPVLLAALPNAINAMAFDQADHTAYFTANNQTESMGFSGSTTETINGNYIYKLSGVTPTATASNLTLTTLNVPFTGASNPGLTAGIAVDSANDTVYFTTAAPALASADPGAKAGVYSLPANFTSATPITTVDVTGISPHIGEEGTIVVDPQTGDYYFTGIKSGASSSAIFSGNIASAAAVTQVTSTGGEIFGLSLVDGVSVTGAVVTAINGNTAKTTGVVQPGNTVTITVTFSDPVSVTGTPTLTLNDGDAASYTSGSGTSSLVFTTTVSATATTTATLGVTALNQTNGTVTSTTVFPTNFASVTASFSGLKVDDTPPTLSVTGTATKAVQGGSSLTVLSGTPAISDSAGTGVLTGAKVQITSGYQTGELLGLNGAQGTSLTLPDSTVLTATYGTGTLTLSGNASTADYATALTDITLTDGATSATQGSHPTIGLSFTVSEGSLTAAPASTQVTVDRAPTVASGGVTATVVEGATATGAALTGDTDADADTLSVATVSQGGTSAAAGTAVAGTYGSLTVNANGAYSYVASNTAAIDAGAGGAPLTDTYSAFRSRTAARRPPRVSRQQSCVRRLCRPNLARPAIRRANRPWWSIPASR